MSIIRAEQEHLPELLRLYASVTRAMRSAGIDQWGEDYPNEEVHRKDVSNGWLYILKASGLQESRLAEAGTIVAAICLNEEQAAEYKEVCWQTVEPVVVVHRLCVDPAWQRGGIGNRLMDFAEDYARQHGYGGIRLDTYSGNPLAVRLYERREYQRAGEVRFRGRSLPFICFEKLLAMEPTAQP